MKRWFRNHWVFGKNRTTFVIAHRLSTIKNAKRILVLTEEGIEESVAMRNCFLEMGFMQDFIVWPIVSRYNAK